MQIPLTTLIVLAILVATTDGKPSKILETLRRLMDGYREESVSKRTEDASVSFESYNIAMMPNLPEYPTRKTFLENFASKLDSDVVCLQELWYTDDMGTVMTEARKSAGYDYSYSFKHSESGHLASSAYKRPCSSYFDFVWTLGCFGWYCNSGSPVDKLICSRDECGMLELEQDCVTCLLNAQGGYLESFYCLTSSRSTNPTGLLVISKLELSNLDAKMFYPGNNQFTPRGHVDIEVADIGSVSCTHLTAHIQGGYLGPPGYDTYQAAQEFEAQELITENHEVILGDLNTGPDDVENNLVGQLQKSIALFKANGYISPVEDLGLCTVCISNGLRPRDSESFLDHILVKTGRETSNAEVACRENLPDKSYPLSDHYCVRLDVAKNEP